MPTPAETVLAQAAAFLGERITTNAALREQHSHGEDTVTPVHARRRRLHPRRPRKPLACSPSATPIACPWCRLALARRWRGM